MNGIVGSVSKGIAVAGLIFVPLIVIWAFANGQADAALLFIGIGIFGVAGLLFVRWNDNRRGDGR